MRGVIMEIQNGRAVLLTKGGGFVNIKDKNYSVGDKVNIALNKGRLRAMAASLVIICAGCIGSYFMPAGYVSVDINPSLMMTVNIYNRVIDVKSLNDDARVLLNKTNIKGKSAEDSVETLIKISEEIGYINDNNRSVILAAVSGIVKPRIENVNYSNINIIKETADMEALRTAQNIGVSIAKAKALEEYTDKNGGDMRSNAVKLSDKSVKEILNIMLDTGNLSDKKADDILTQTPKPQGRKIENISEPPAYRENKSVNYEQPYIINKNTFTAGEIKRGNDISSVNQSTRNKYEPPENISVQGDGSPQEIPFELGEQPSWNIAAVNSQSMRQEQKTQDDNILQRKPQQTSEPAQQNPPVDAEPIQTEQKPRESAPYQSDRNLPDGISELSEPVRGDDKPSTDGGQTTEQKPQDSIPNQDGEDTHDIPPQTGNQNPEATAPSEKQPPEEQEPSGAEPDSDKPQDNPAAPAETKLEPVVEQSGQPPQSDNDTYKSQSGEPKRENNMPPQAEPEPWADAPIQNSDNQQNNARHSGEADNGDAFPQSEQPRQSEPKPQNDGGNHISNEGFSGHSENTELP